MSPSQTRGQLRLVYSKRQPSAPRRSPGASMLAVSVGSLLLGHEHVAGSSRPILYPPRSPRRGRDQRGLEHRGSLFADAGRLPRRSIAGPARRQRRAHGRLPNLGGGLLPRIAADQRPPKGIGYSGRRNIRSEMAALACADRLSEPEALHTAALKYSVDCRLRSSLSEQTGGRGSCALWRFDVQRHLPDLFRR
jgi:hypothetical protein